MDKKQFIAILKDINIKTLAVDDDGADYEHSIYAMRVKNARTKKILPFEKMQQHIIKHLAEIGSIEDNPTEVSKALLECAYEVYVNGEDITSSVAKINKDTCALISPMKWHINKLGETIYYIRLSGENKEYALVTNLIGGLKKSGQYSTILKKYEKLYNEGKLFGLKPKKDEEEEKTLMPFSKYWEGILKPYWEDDVRFYLEKIPDVISNDKNIPCLKTILIDDFKKDKHDTWLNWETCIPEKYRDVWRAFFYSIFKSSNRGRQLMWLFDPNGFTGKSTVQRVVTKFLGDDLVAACPTKNSTNQFTASKFFGKRLFVVDDAKDNSIIRYQLYHSAVSGGIVDVEMKQANSFCAEIYCKGLVSSNIPPVFDTTVLHESSRIIVLPLQYPDNLHEFVRVDENGEPCLDPNGNPKPLGSTAAVFEDKLSAEIESYIAYCKDAYVKLCPSDTEIDLPDELLWEMSGLCSPTEHFIWAQFFDTYFVAEKGEYVSKYLMNTKYTEKMKTKNNHEYNNFLKWLLSEHGIVGKRIRLEDDTRINVLYNVREKTESEIISEREDEEKENDIE